VRRSWIPLVGWGALLLVWTAAQLPFSPDGTELGLLGGAGAFCVVLGGAVFLGERRRGVARDVPDAPQHVPDTSAPTALLALGICVLVVGWELGLWAVYLGSGMAVIGAGALVRERRAERMR